MPLFLQLFDDGLLFLGRIPGAQEMVERGEFLQDALAGEVAQGLGDELAARAVVLHPLLDHVNRHVVDEVADAPLPPSPPSGPGGSGSAMTSPPGGLSPSGVVSSPPGSSGGTGSSPGLGS